MDCAVFTTHVMLPDAINRQLIECSTFTAAAHFS